MMEKAIYGPMPSYVSLAEHMTAQVFVFSADGRFSYVNPSFCRFAGLSRDELLGRHAHECIPAGADHNRPFNAVLQGAGYHERIMKSGKTLVREESLIGYQRRERHFKVIHSPVFEENGKLTGTQGIRFDITREKKLESDLSLARRQNETFNKVFNRNIHRIYPLMHAILEFSTRLTEPLPDAEEKNNYVNLVVDNVYGLLNVWEDFLNSSNNDRRVGEGLFKENIDVLDVCHNIFRTFEALPQPEKRVNFLFEPPRPPAHQVSIRTDLYRFIYVLTTLLFRAFSLTYKGDIHFGYIPKVGKISFYIKVSGLHYPAEMHDNLFCSAENRNYRLSDSEDLFLCKTYVLQLDGRIQVQSGPEQGTLIYVTFPTN
ncbi:MAG: PAS domain S-box protein [Mangrovibacterium sp.]